MPRAAWDDLAGRAIEPNGYHLAAWQLAVDASAPGRTGASALTAFAGDAATASLTGLLPVVPFRQAYGLPLPVLVSADPYGTLGTPLLDRAMADDAAASLLNEARKAGARALVLRNVTPDGPAFAALAGALARDGLAPRIVQSQARACLDATQQAEALLRDALGARKLKELRRQRRRLSERGAVRFEVARTPAEVREALETFLTLESSGWKGRRGTALLNREGDARFIRAATPRMAETGGCEIVSLHAGSAPVAAAVVLRHQHRAFYFKLGIDEAFAKFSPGVQLTLDLTRHLCADPLITSADSTAPAGHTMIEPIWRGRLTIADVLLPLYRNDAATALARAVLTTRGYARSAARRLRAAIRRDRGGTAG